MVDLLVLFLLCANAALEDCVQRDSECLSEVSGRLWLSASDVCHQCQMAEWQQVDQECAGTEAVIWNPKRSIAQMSWKGLWRSLGPHPLHFVEEETAEDEPLRNIERWVQNGPSILSVLPWWTRTKDHQAQALAGWELLHRRQATAFQCGHVTLLNCRGYREMASGGSEGFLPRQSPAGNHLSSLIIRGLPVFTMCTKWLLVSKRNELFKGL